MKKIFLLGGMFIISVTGMGKTAAKTAIKGNVTAAVRKSEINGGTVAADFINEFVDLNETVSMGNMDVEMTGWLRRHPVTENFIKYYSNQEKAIEMGYEVLDGRRKLTAGEKKFVEEYTAELGPVFGAAWDSLSKTVVINNEIITKPVYFEVKSFDEKTGKVILRENFRKIELPVKVVRINGRWLVDGAGTVNMPK